MARAFPCPSQKASASSPAADIKKLLKQAAGYCGKLESAAFDFVCREVIAEAVSPIRITRIVRDSHRELSVDRARPIKQAFEYDYQCIRSGGVMRERRTLLKENGKATNEPDAKLKTSVVVFGTALMGPVGLFGERFQPDYDYVVSGQGKMGKTKVLVVDAKPKPGAPESTNLYGRAWIDPVTGDILKIEWNESRVGRLDIFEERGRPFGLKPRLVIRSEFTAEKSGIRFPSRLFIEEAYVDGKGRVIVRSKTDVIYRDFKFFTVEVEVRD